MQRLEVSCAAKGYGLAFIIEMESVYCAVRTVSLNVR
jgi:hypothetical protein